MTSPPVEFRSENPAEMIRADLYTPATGKGPWPTLIMGGGWCYVKELTMLEYAQYFLPEGLRAAQEYAHEPIEQPFALGDRGHGGGEVVPPLAR